MGDVSEREALLALPVEKAPFALLDVESTGLEAATGDRVCEVALLHLEGGVVGGQFETLINPGRPIEPAAYAVNGIEAAALVGAPTFSDIADALMHELEGKVLVAHNVPFDAHFLNMELARLGRPSLPNILVDTLTLARSFLDYDRYSLHALSRAIGFDRPAHRAMSDVIALQALFHHLLDRLGRLGVATVADLVRAQRGLLPGQPEPEAPPLIAEALRRGTRLRIAYRTNGGAPVVRDILPLEFQGARDAPRLVAYCYLRNGQRTFYLDRISEMALPPPVDG